MTLQPAYGRDYKSVKDVKADFENNKDFLICAWGFSGYANKEDIKKMGVTVVWLRYSNLRKTTMVKL